MQHYFFLNRIFSWQICFGLLQAQQLFRFGQMRPNTGILRLGGEPGAGKSTVADTLATGRFKGLFRNESQPDEGDQNPHQRTKGMRLVEVADKDSAKIMIMDLGGQGEYFMTHQALVTVDGMPVNNGVTLSVLKAKARLRYEAKRWASFFACRSRPGAVRQPLIFLATRKEKANVDQKSNMADVFLEISCEFAKFFKFPYRPFLIDARKSYSLEMVEVRVSLRCLMQEVLNVSTCM